MDYYEITPVIKACDLALQLFSEDTDRVAETLFLGQYSGPNDVEYIRRTILELDSAVGEELESKISKWTEDFVNIADLRKLNLSSWQACLLAFRLENARDNIPRLLGGKDHRPTYELRIRAAAEAFAVQWALTAFWSLTRDAYADCEALYLSDVMSAFPS